MEAQQPTSSGNMEMLTPLVQNPKIGIRWRQWIVVFSVGIFGIFMGWKKAEQRYPSDSSRDVRAVETAIGELLEGAVADNMPHMIEQDDYAAAVGNLSQAMSKLATYASNLEIQSVPNGFVSAYPNYDAAWTRFLTAFGHLHTRDNRLKATMLYYSAAGWYPNPPTDDHDWRKLKESVPWQLTEGVTVERAGYVIGYGGGLAALAWIVIILPRWGWNFLLARIHEVSQAVRG